MSAEIRRARDDAELAAALALRTEVFVAEQGVPAELEVDGDDADAVHLVAVDEQGAVQATCRLYWEQPGERLRIGRLCVRRSARGRGLAAGLLAEAEREARAAGARSLVMHAQTSALPLYLRTGYEPRGERFDEAGIEHLAMEKPLA